MTVSLRLDREVVARLRQLVAERNLIATFNGTELRSYQDCIREAVDTYLKENA